MSCVDGFVLPVLKNRLDAHRRMSRLRARIWREYGVRDYREKSRRRG